MRVLWRRRARVATVGLAAAIALMGIRGDRRPAAAQVQPAIDALAPVDVVASGFVQPSGIAAEPGGAILVTDRAAGTLTRIHHDGALELLLHGLHGPAGVAVDAGGAIFLVEGTARRVLRVGPRRTVTVVVATPWEPLGVAVGPEGRLWVAMRTDTGAEGVIASVEFGALRVVAGGLMGLRGFVATRAGIYVAVARLAAEHDPVGTAVARIPIREDGSAGPVEPLVDGGLHRALTVGVDALGELFIGATIDDHKEHTGVVLKRQGDGRVTAFAAGFGDPAALAFRVDGDLVVIEQRLLGRVLRFRSPPPPAPSVPAFTNRSPVDVGGRALAGDRVQLFGPVSADPLAAVIADAHGEFALTAPLALNGTTELLFRATAAGGLGLTSRASHASVVHDDVVPRVAPLAPPPGTHVSRTVTLRARADDDGSGVAELSFLLDDAVAATVGNEAPLMPLVATAVLDTAAAAEGPHGLTVAALDRAGNRAAVAQLLVVDRTPPDTEIVRGPGAETTESDVRFDVAGSDVWSPALEFSWRFDEGAWSPYEQFTAIVLNGVAPGRHRFEVRARDLAGNEDPTPAARDFTVAPLRVRILEPAPDSIVTTETVWVRGIVEGGEPTALEVPLPPEIRDELPVESVAVPTIAGTFAVEVPVTLETTSLTVVAVARDSSATDSVPVSVQPPLLPATGGLQAWPAAGLAPHPVTFDARSLPAGSYVLDIDSDGLVEYAGETLEGQEFTYARPGVHLATLRVATAAGELFQARTSVQVYDRAAVDLQVRAAWSGFKNALRAGEVDRAAAFVHGVRRARWADFFRQLTPAAFSDIDDVFTEVTLVDVAPGRVECEMLREVDGAVYSFPVSFVLDADGSWRLWQF